MISSSLLKKRHQNLQQTLKEKSIQCLLVSNFVNISYLTGLTSLNPVEREVFMVVTPDEIIVYASPLIKDLFHLKEVTIFEMSPERRLSGILTNLDVGTIHFEASDLRVAELNQLQSKVSSVFKPAPWLVGELREIKDEYELEQIKQSGKIAHQAWDQVKTVIKPGMTELDITKALLVAIDQLGADGVPLGFKPIVASGPNSAIPHHQPGERKIEAEEPVLVDFGCQVNGYVSDMTRTIWVGKSPSEEFLETKRLVDLAYSQSLGELERTRKPQMAEDVVNHLFETNGQKSLIHALGHGVGLAIHETPSISHYTSVMLKDGMVITIEPGLYHQGKFGYRYENTLIVDTPSFSVTTLES